MSYGVCVSVCVCVCMSVRERERETERERERERERDREREIIEEFCILLVEYYCAHLFMSVSIPCAPLYPFVKRRKNGALDHSSAKKTLLSPSILIYLSFSTS